MKVKHVVIAALATGLMAVGGLLGVDHFGSHGTSSPKTTLVSYGTVCRTVTTNSQWSTVIVPKMYIPICYNGDHIWQNGNVSAGVRTFGYTLSGIDWAGTYNGGGNWLGAGMNYRVTLGNGWAGYTCLTRWSFDANGNQTSYKRNC